MHSVICSGLDSLECFVITKCTKFDQLILRKIVKIVATRCQILRLKCTKFDFGWGSAPDPTGGAYSGPPDPLAGFKGPISKGTEGRGSEGEGEEGVRKKERGRGREREGKAFPLLLFYNLTTASDKHCVISWTVRAVVLWETGSDAVVVSCKVLRFRNRSSCDRTQIACRRRRRCAMEYLCS